MFLNRDSSGSLGHAMIQTYFGRGPTASVVIGVRVVFPKPMMLGTKSFSYSVHGVEGALDAALKHRNAAIHNLIKNTL